MAATDDALAYERELTSTEEGRRSITMRAEIESLHKQRRVEEAHLTTEAMVRLFADSDDGAAAAAARHDLARSYSDRKLGVPLENLNAAAELAGRALASPARSKVAQRRIQTERQLATILRQRSEYLAPDEADADLREAEELLRGALSTAEAIGPVGLPQVPQLASNLGNLLMDRGDVTAAIRFHERALEGAQALAKLGEGSPEDLARILLNAASARQARRESSDLRRAEELLSRALDLHVPGQSDLAGILLARSFLDRGERSRAKSTVDRIRWDTVDVEHVLDVAAQLLRELGDERGRRLLQKIMDDSVTERSGTIAEHAADWAVLPAQRAASLAARFDVEDGLHFRAFLLLENTSGLRFGEALRTYLYCPDTDLERACLERWRDEGLIAGLLENFIPQSVGIPTSVWEAAVTTMFRPGFESSAIERFRAIIAGAVQAADPPGTLKQAYQSACEQAEKSIAVLRQRSETFRRIDGLMREEVSESALEEVLRKHPNHVLVRVSISESDLVAVGVWSENGALKTGATRIPVPHDLEERVCGRGIPDGELLTKLDLTKALPVGGLGTVVLLPSYEALRLPLIAFGPEDSRLVDRADAVIWLPNLVALRSEPAVMPPRSGELVVEGPDTLLSGLAFSRLSADSHRLSGAEATPEAVVEGGERAAVVSIYTHGSWNEKPALLLSGSALQQHHIGFTWHGLERIELFACKSGLARPLDVRAPPSDEGLGLDFEFLKVGVRSAIASMWSVPEVSTAAICNRYRELMAEGISPPSALLSAQRWWIREGFSQQSAGLQAAPSSGADDLAPVPFDKRPAPTNASEWLLWPSAWAGLRFAGVHGQRPHVVPWDLISATPSPEGRAELDSILARLDEAPEADAAETRLNELVRAAHEQVPAQLALEVAALYRWRHASGHEHNLLFGLAWLHEAMLSATQAEGDLLAIEAAHLWLDLATCHVSSLRLLQLKPAAPVFLSRARALTTRSGLDARMPKEQTALLARLTVIKTPTEEIAASVWRAWAPDLSGECDARTLSQACDTLGLLGKSHHDSVTQVLRAIGSFFSTSPGRASPAEAAHLAARACQLARDSDNAVQFIPKFDALTPADVESVVGYLLGTLDAADPRLGDLQLKIASDAMSSCELPLHGYPSDSKADLIRSSGGHGQPYHRLLGMYLSGQAENSENAIHVLAGLELASDQRTAVVHKLSRFANLSGVRHQRNPFSEIAGSQGAVDDGLRSLADQAAMPSLSDSDSPQELDPFRLTPSELKPERVSEDGLAAWSLADDLERLAVAAEGRTAAFRTVRAAERARRRDADNWDILFSTMKEDAAKSERSAQAMGVLSRMAPVLRLEQLEERLRTMSRQIGVLGMHLDSLGRLTLATAFPAENGFQLRTASVRVPELTATVPSLLLPSPVMKDADRKKKWTSVLASLDPLFSKVWPKTAAPCDWVVLAPGLLRPLPVVGLTSGSTPLLGAARSLTMVPSLSFLDSIPDGPRGGLACLFVPSAVGPFTGAVLRGLRRLQPPAKLLDPVNPRRGNIVETDAISAFATSMSALRIVSEGTVPWNDTSSTLLLDSERQFRPENVPTELACRTVGLWASTAGVPDMKRASGEYRDGPPELVRQFLSSGAHGVIDLAWPVPDLIRALVLEMYTAVATHSGEGPFALSQAVRIVRSILGEWAPASFRQGTVTNALILLDQARLVFGRKLGLITDDNGNGFRAFAGLTGAVDASLAEFVAATTDPTALAAFRYWGL
jgi:hypothetical protein